MMRRATIFFTIIISLSYGFPQQIRQIKLKNLSSQVKSLNSYKDQKIVILDFWATWCKPCIKSMPELEKIYQKYRAQDVLVIGINTDSPRNWNKIKPLINQMNINYPILIDYEGKLQNILQINSIPTLLILDSNFNIIKRFIGYRPGEKNKITEKIKILLKESP